MAYEQRPNSGSVFPNDDMREGKKDPHFKGKAEVDGKMYWVSAWRGQTKNGNEYFSFRFNPIIPRAPGTGPEKAAPKVEPPAPKQSAPQQPDFDDDIPF